MDSNINVLNEFHLMEANGIKDDTWEQPVEEKMTVDSNGNEAYPEGIAVETPSVVLEVTDELATEGRKAENVDSIISYLQDEKELELIDDDEKFEEAIEASIEDDEKFEEAVEAPTPVVQSVLDGTDRKIEVQETEDAFSNQLAMGETEQSENSDTVECGNKIMMQVADLDDNVETGTSLFAKRVNEKPIEVSNDSENGALSHLSPGETISCVRDNCAMTADEGKLDEKLERQDVHEFEGGDGNSQKKFASYRDVLLRSEKNIFARKISDTAVTGVQDSVHVPTCNSVITATNFKGDKQSDMEERDSMLLEADGKIDEWKDASPSDTSVHGENMLFNDGIKEKEFPELESWNQGKSNGEQKEFPELESLVQCKSNGEQRDIQCNDSAASGFHNEGSFKLHKELKAEEFPDLTTELHEDTPMECKAITDDAVFSLTPNISLESPICIQENKHKDVQNNNGVLYHQAGSLKLPADSKESVPVPDTGHEGGISVGYKATSPEVGNAHPFNDSTDSNVVSPAGSSNVAVNFSKHSQPQVVNAALEIPNAQDKEPDNKQVIYVEEKLTAPKRRQEDTESETDSSSSPASAIHLSSSATSVTPTPTPAGLGRAAPLLEPAPRVAPQPRVNGAPSSVQSQLIEESTTAESDECDETREKLQMIRVKFLRLAHRLGQTPHNVVVAQVLYRLGLAEQLRGRNGGRVAPFSFDRASGMAEQLEAAGQEPLDFSCTIMVLGKTGVGKSATINSIFDEGKFGTDAFQIGTKKVQDVIGTVQGIKVRVIDTPGLLPSWSDQRQNEKTLHSVKNFIKKTPPDIVLYLDRLDTQSRDYGDMPLLRTITDIFGPSIWFNAIVVLTHAASAPPEGPNGTVTSYDMFVTQRSHAVQQAIRQAAGDMRLMNPVSLVENHSACRTNRAGQRVLPNGQVWKPHLLLLSFASKILAEANTLLKLQDSPPGRNFASRSRSPPLPFLLSSLLQSRPQVKLPTEQFGDDDETFGDDLDESDSEEESEYDKLPPFKCLTKAQLGKLTKEQRKAYFDELEYREKLLMRNQLKEERRRRKLFKMQAATKDVHSHPTEIADEDINGAASVPVPMPDLALPASFDSDNPTHRYRCLDSSNQWLVRPVLDSQGWDHDIGYEGINVERMFVIKEKIPISLSGQASKDKKDSNLQLEIASSLKHGNGKVTSLGLDMQSLGKDVAYTFRTETKFINFRRNKATAGLSATLLGDAITGGVKVEDKLIVSKRGQIVISGGAMFGRGDVAYGGCLEATLRDKDHPLGRFLSTLGLSLMDWHGDLAIGCNSQTQIPVGRHTNLIGRVNINNRGSGQVSLRLTSSEQLQIALVCLVPLARKILGYSQTVQYS
ncbi:unnamed protein product [Cuscuta europaea]|uniref:AIG1-type G domain-containing protein n=1 Tax=Cuscuta europaea TaxID=41803 RepID=A0A9P0YMJ2_CUSEU|nr:unnamed protein product [Cuscuta europaea]